MCGINSECESISAIEKGRTFEMQLQVKTDKSNWNAIDSYYMSELFDGEKIAKTLNGQAVFAGIGRIEDYENINVKNKIVLVNRGEIVFDEKLINAKNAGAIAIILINSSDNEFEGSLSNKTQFPMIAISKTDGLKLVDLLSKKNVVSFGATVSVKEFRIDAPSKHNGSSDYPADGSL